MNPAANAAVASVDVKVPNGTHLHLREMEEPVALRLPYRNVPLDMPLDCVYYDPAVAEWSTEGVRLDTAEGSFVRCNTSRPGQERGMADELYEVLETSIKLQI